LKWLGVDNNEITSINVLQDLPSLKYLSIGGNKIEDYSVISNLDSTA
jgi:Leucine-rich repeat (LRR) protein